MTQTMIGRPTIRWLMISAKWVSIRPNQRNVMNHGTRKLRPGVIRASRMPSARPFCFQRARLNAAGTPINSPMAVQPNATIVLLSKYLKNGFDGLLNTNWYPARVGLRGMKTGGDAV